MGLFGELSIWIKLVDNEMFFNLGMSYCVSIEEMVYIEIWLYFCFKRFVLIFVSCRCVWECDKFW